MKKLPKHVYDYVNKSFTFNRFGIINLNLLKFKTGTTLSIHELRKRITNQFNHEMNGNIEFLPKQKTLTDGQKGT